MVGLALATPARAEEPDLDRFKAEIDAFLGRLGPSSNGVVKWAGSDPYEIRREGGALVAVIANARLSFETRQVGNLTLDSIEIRQIGQREDGKLIELALSLPKEMTLSEADGTETKIALKDASVNALVEAGSGRGRETTVKIAGTRIDQAKTGAWVSVGPISMASKLVDEPDGGWSGPVEFEVNEIAYFIPQGPVGGGINRILFSSNGSGPRLGSSTSYARRSRHCRTTPASRRKREAPPSWRSSRQSPPRLVRYVVNSHWTVWLSAA